MRVLMTGLGNKVLDVAFSPDCRAVAAALEATYILLWNLDSPTLAPIRLEADGAYVPGGLRFSADGRQLSWQNSDGFRRYNRDDRGTISDPFPHLRTAITWGGSDSGARAVSAHGMPDHFLAGWQSREGEWVRQWQISTRDLFVGCLTLAPEGDRFVMLTRLAPGGRWWEQPMRLEVRDAVTATEVAIGTYPYSYPGRLRFHPTGEQIAGINDMTLLMWPLPTGGDPRRVRNDNRKHFTAIAYHPSGRVIYATSNDGTVHAFDTQSLNRVKRYSWHLDKLSAVVVSPDGTLAAAGSAMGDVIVWDLD